SSSLRFVCVLPSDGGFASSDQSRSNRSAMQRRGRPPVLRESLLTRAVSSVFAFVHLAEFEILFFLFFFVAFIIFKDLTSRPEYNQIFVKKPGGEDFWPFRRNLLLKTL
ncbi:unnamed protein product, partial [Musa acuminata var. zebrina]